MRVAHGVDGGADGRGGLALIVHEARDPEVGELRDEAEWRRARHRVLLGHEDVAWLQVAVHDALVVQRLHARRYAQAQGRITLDLKTASSSSPSSYIVVVWHTDLLEERRDQILGHHFILCAHTKEHVRL